ncbi:hypothetical protein TNIN_316881 [Trichonephila inaurata madagascariensis]|uniref:Uncharacterized protein n=1 Tax=Trichonephila inaurata madagascariensis TaxID=2747483 RepID=A0A8X6Y1L4_9ARAC|nr:hypothetical protein TNIN_316881 [Trichonephila inaurata madagascariensis]
MTNNGQTKQWTIEDLDHFPECPKRDAVASFRILIGLNCLGKHRRRTDIFAKHFAVFLNLESPSLLVTIPNSPYIGVPENVLSNDFGNLLY